MPRELRTRSGAPRFWRLPLGQDVCKRGSFALISCQAHFAAALMPSAAGLDPRPKTIDQPLRLLVVGEDDVEARHGGGVWIDGAVVADSTVNEGAGPVAVGIEHVIGILRR